MDNFSQFTYLPNSTGCTVFAIHEAQKVIVASSKKRLLVYKLGEDVQLSQSLVKEIGLSGHPFPFQ